MTLTDEAERIRPLLDAFKSACNKRDRSGAYAAQSKIIEALNPNEPVDINKVKAIAHIAAHQMFGWEMNP